MVAHYPAVCCDRALRNLISTGEAGRLRRAAGITQADMGRGLGVSSPMMNRVENRRDLVPWRWGPAYLRVLRALAWHEAVSREIKAGLWDHVPDYETLGEAA